MLLQAAKTFWSRREGVADGRFSRVILGLRCSLRDFFVRALTSMTASLLFSMDQHVVGGERLNLRYLRKTKLRGFPDVTSTFTLAAAAHDLVRLTKLVGAAA